MKKILYYTAKDMTNPSLGINKKIRNQIELLRKFFQVDAVYRRNNSDLILEKNSGKEVTLVAGLKRPFKVQQSYFMTKYLEKHFYDGCYIRYVYADREFQKLLKNLHASGTRTIIEIPTYPYDEELKDSLENGIVLLLDKLYRNRMKPYVYRIATYSRDKEIYGIPAFQVVNGVDFSKISPCVHSQETDGSIRMIAVAELAPWHGYDRLLRGMGEYYKNGGKRDLHFYMVGMGKELELYREITEEYQIEERVTFCGPLYAEELDQIYDQCNLAVECLGNHRKGLTLSSSLKSREYAAKGLPMISSVDIDVFETGKYPYLCRLKGNEDPVDIEQVIAFFDRIYSDKDINTVAAEIREYAQKLCDMEVVMRKVVSQLSEEEEE